MDETAGRGIAVQSILRIYLRRRTRVRQAFFKNLFTPPLSTQLVKEALIFGITYATITLGHSGYVTGAIRVAHSQSEVDIDTLPTCVELIAPRSTLQAFMHDHAIELSDAVVVWIEGASISPS